MDKWIIFLGGLIILVSWLTQTFLFERWNGRLADVRAAQSTFLTYQSNNALFSALTKTAPRELWKELWDLQNSNYEYGLIHLRAALSERRQHQLRQKISDMAKQPPYAAMGQHGYRAAEVVAVQQELLNEKAEIESYRHRAEIAFWLLYFIGSTVLLAGNLLHE